MHPKAWWGGPESCHLGEDPNGRDISGTDSEEAHGHLHAQYYFHWSGLMWGGFAPPLPLTSLCLQGLRLMAGGREWRFMECWPTVTCPITHSFSQGQATILLIPPLPWAWASGPESISTLKQRPVWSLVKINQLPPLFPVLFWGLVKKNGERLWNGQRSLGILSMECQGLSRLLSRLEDPSWVVWFYGDRSLCIHVEI